MGNESDFQDVDKYGEPHQVPLVLANNTTLKGYGHLVQDFDTEEVEITTWPQMPGRRPLRPGTGRGGGVWEHDLLYVTKNKHLAVGLMPINDPTNVFARIPDAAAANRDFAFVRKLNYHPDGGQVFYPKDPGTAFVMLLALPGDQVKLEDIVAFYFDGTCGLQIHADVWHAFTLPATESRAVFRNKQGRVLAIVDLDTVEEFGKFLQVPLKP